MEKNEVMGKVYTNFKTIVKKWTPHGLIFILKFSETNELISYISGFPEVWPFKKREKFLLLYWKILPLLCAQFSKINVAPSSEDFFASLQNRVTSMEDVDPEMKGLCWTPEKTLHESWPQALTQGLRYWFCARCGRTYWWGPWGSGRTQNGHPCVQCLSCMPPQPGQALVCGRGEEHHQQERTALWTHVIPYNKEPRPQHAAAVWVQDCNLAEMYSRNWTVRTCIAPTRRAALSHYPQEIKALNRLHSPWLQKERELRATI